ncbi:MAG: hypothetical protein DYH20_03035 [Gammaproteobacteria bacterium PRO9]|nr:hypothetical protein [Gammaproteobacteria bacterium PRO9]
MKRRLPVSMLAVATAGLLALTGAQAQNQTTNTAESAKAVVASPRATFDQEVCKVDGLSTTECDCAWTYLSAKLSAGDLKLALLLTASNSDDPETARQADSALDKSNASDKRRDSLLSDFSGMVIDAEDACVK